MGMKRLAVLLAVCLPLVACGTDDPHPVPVPQGFLFEKGPYQALYGPDGKIMRLLYDSNGDKKVDVVTEFYPNGKPRVSEMDQDHNGVIDLWEYYFETGGLEKIGQSRRKPGKVDIWLFHDAKGVL